MKKMWSAVLAYLPNIIKRRIQKKNFFLTTVKRSTYECWMGEYIYQDFTEYCLENNTKCVLKCQ